METIVRDPDRARAAALVRRATLGVHAEVVERLAGEDWASAVGILVDEARQPARGLAAGTPPQTGDWGDAVTWWLERMIAPEGGLRERLAWFWHGFLTTNADKVSSAELVRDQLLALRANATGDYRSLLHAYVGSGALLQYLDASWSMANNPNENLARELMELFTIGRGNYDEDDVRAAARALAGWVVDEDGIEWRRENAFVAPLLFRGVQDEWDTTKIVDHLCDQPETAVNVSSRLRYHLTGVWPDPDQGRELGEWWQGRGLDIADLAERILLDADPGSGAATGPATRPRTGLEWFTAVWSVTGRTVEAAWQLDRLGQVPYQPPNVGGWPDGDRWLAPGSLLGRVSMAMELDPSSFAVDWSATTEDVLDRCGLHQVSQATYDAVDGVRSADDLPPDAVLRTRWRVALTSPEFNLL